MVLPVIHTGGYGLARGTAAEQAKQLTRLPPRAEDQFDQKLWNLHAQKRRILQSLAEESTGGFSAPAVAPVDLPTFYKEVFRDQLRKLLAEIGGSCAGRKKWGFYAENFIAKAVADGVAASLTAESAELRTALNRGTAACYTEAGQACVVGKDGKAVVPMLVYWRQLVFAGATNLVDAGKLQSCLTFEFEFSTVLDHSDAQFTKSAHHRIDTRGLFIRWRPPFATGTPASAPHNYLEAKWTWVARPGECVTSATGRVKPGTLTVYEMLFLGVNSFEESPPLPKIEIVYNPGNPELELQVVCPLVTDLDFFPMFATHYVIPHALEIDGELDPTPLFPEVAFRVRDWDVRLGALYAIRAYQRTLNLGARVSEVTNLYVFHKPGA